jgi:hypothetical protein
MVLYTPLSGSIPKSERSMTAATRLPGSFAEEGPALEVGVLIVHPSFGNLILEIGPPWRVEPLVDHLNVLRDKFHRLLAFVSSMSGQCSAEAIARARRLVAIFIFVHLIFVFVLPKHPLIV